MPEWLVAAGAIALALTVNALRPVRVRFVQVWSYLAGWCFTEFPGYLLVAEALVTVGLVAGGALDAWPGVVGLGLMLASWCGLAALVADVRRTPEVVERALAEAFGPYHGVRPGSTRVAHPAVRRPLRMLLLPLPVRPRDVESIRDLAYAPGGRRNRLDVYVARNRPARAPVLLQIHGGGWVAGNKRQQGRPLMNELARRGWVCVAANYRLGPRATWPDQLIDLKRAVLWIREHIREWGGDPGFVVTTGGSAGGHLAAMLALAANDPRYQPGFEHADTSIQGCVPFYATYDLLDRHGVHPNRSFERYLARFLMKTTRAESPQEYAAASPVSRVTPDAPAFFVVHGTLDSLAPIDDARHFVDALRAVSCRPVAFASLPGGQHGFDVLPSARTQQVAAGVDGFLAIVRSSYLEARSATPGDGQVPDPKATAVDHLGMTTERPCR